MLYREIIAVCSEIHTKHTNTLCGQNVEFFNVKLGGTYSNHWALKGYSYMWWYGRHETVSNLRGTAECPDTLIASIIR
jgi:hypothetical protein